MQRMVGSDAQHLDSPRPAFGFVTRMLAHFEWPPSFSRYPPPPPMCSARMTRQLGIAVLALDVRTLLARRRRAVRMRGSKDAY